MRRILLIISLVLLLGVSLVSAITQQEINEAKNLIDSKVSCDKLTDEQLEIIGEYYMEQMHPGESHELMHKMMGLEEGSEAEEQFHINMAKAIYCGGTNAFGPGGMMGMVNMMSGGMTGRQNPTQTSMAQGMGMMQSMMGSNVAGFGIPFWDYGYFSIGHILYALLLIGLIALVLLGAFKLWKDVSKKGA